MAAANCLPAKRELRNRKFHAVGGRCRKTTLELREQSHRFLVGSNRLLGMLRALRKKAEVVLDRSELERILRDQGKLARQFAEKPLRTAEMACRLVIPPVDKQRAETVADTRNLPPCAGKWIRAFNGRSHQFERRAQRCFRFRRSTHRSLQDCEVVPISNQLGQEIVAIAKLLHE